MRSSVECDDKLVYVDSQDDCKKSRSKKHVQMRKKLTINTGAMSIDTIIEYDNTAIAFTDSFINQSIPYLKWYSFITYTV